MTILEKIGRWWKSLFSVKHIEQMYKLDAAVSDEMLTCIGIWSQMYAGHAAWVDGENVVSLRIEQSIVREFANVTLNEMTWNTRSDALRDLVSPAIAELNLRLQRALAVGGMVMKPLGVGSTQVQFLPQGSYLPLHFDASGRLTDVVFPEIKRITDTDYRIRLERHTVSAQGLTITNRAFRSRSPDMLGMEIPLTSVEEWAALPPAQHYPQMTRPSFGYFVVPADNLIDGSRNGVSIFECAAPLIRKADEQFGRIEWEYESAARRIVTDEQGFRKTPDGKAVIPDKIFTPIDQQDLFHEFSPALRDAGFRDGLNAVKREIEFCVGLSYGDLSDPQTVDKTATEVLSAKQRKYNTVTAIQAQLHICLDDLVYATAFWNAMTRSYDFSCTFEDSILTTDAERRELDRQEVAMGAMSLLEYRMKWYGEDRETAQRNLPASAEVML